jgi:hypothetical protein
MQLAVKFRKSGQESGMMKVYQVELFRTFAQPHEAAAMHGLNAIV